MKKVLIKVILFLVKIAKNLEDDIVNNQCQKLCNANENVRFYKTARICLLNEEKNSVVIKSNCHIRGELLIFRCGGFFEMGENCYIGENSHIWSAEHVKIGNNVLISHNVNIMDTDSHEIDHIERSNGFVNLTKNGHPNEKGSIKTAPIIIEDYAWISFNATILKGVTIGRGAIVAAGSIVTKNVAPFTLVAGNPAKIIKKLNEKIN